jgi:hypothetical protein
MLLNARKLSRYFLSDTTFQRTQNLHQDERRFFVTPRSKGYVFETPPTVIIYGVAKKTSQEQYLAALNAIRLNMGIKQLRVKFYEQENWIEWGSKETGASGGDRGAERLIRKETLASVGVTPVA